MEPVNHLFLSFLFSVAISAGFITTDDLGNIYAVEKNNSLTKLDANGKTLFTTQHPELGLLSFVDANSVKPLLWYPDQHTAVITDNTLATQSQINFRNSEILMPELICWSSDSRFWIFDEASQSLIKADEQAHILLKSNDMISLTGFALQPFFLREQNNQVWLVDSIGGTFLFDRFGTLVHHFPNINKAPVSLSGSKLFSVEHDTFRFFDPVINETVSFTIQDQGEIFSFAISNDHLILAGDSVVVFQMTK